MSETRADPQRAFRAGLGGREPTAPGGGPGLAETAPGWARGANEALVLAMHRLPGLTEAKAAFETGRALRIIARLLDEVGAPARVGEQFRDNLVAAAIAHASRPGARPWGGEDTIAMFMELYRRTLGPADPAATIVEHRLLAWIREELRPLPGQPRSEPRPAHKKSLKLAA